MSKISRVIWILAMVSLLTACLGLGSKDEDDNTPHYYVIDVDRGAIASTFAVNRVLYLKPVKLTPHFRSQTMVFRIANNEYKLQPPHQFFSDPEEMLTEQLKRWLQKSGLFSQVVTDDKVGADMVLETAVTALYGDQREQYSPQSILEMQFFLLTADENHAQPLFQTGLRIEINIEETTPAKVVKGWKQGLEELLATLEDDFSDYFSKRRLR
ncbi:MAG: ABC transporter [Methylophaga sp.]|nr:MAG: ABC transporter [Methylophaga sp.]